MASQDNGRDGQTASNRDESTIDSMQIEENPQQQQREASNSAPPAISVQRSEMKRLLDLPLRKDETWYLIDSKWLDQYKKYINYDFATAEDDETPGSSFLPRAIDNSDLIETSNASKNNNITNLDKTNSSQRVKMSIMDKQDYELIPALAWQKLASWYGGGPAIPRKVYEIGVYSKQTRVELHPCFVHAALYTMEDALAAEPQPFKFHELYFAKHETLKDVKESLATFFQCDGPDFETHLWAAFKGSPYRMYKSADLAKELENILTRSDGQQLVLEVKNKRTATTNTSTAVGSDNGWPLAYKHSDKVGGQTAQGLQAGFFNSGATLGYPDVTSRIDRNANEGHGDGNGSAGVCGLTNLGNTCFMNSALQCLAKTPTFRKYFCSQLYKKEINYDNPLGMKGRIALAFGNLMQDMWSSKYNSVTPREFKTTIGQFAPQFSGYSQQDSQELVAYLLDGLHEDLNRIQKKPATEPVESKGRADHVVSKEAWETHKLRNDSFVVDNFQGQLKSTLVCPEQECLDANFISVTFDPFMYLSVPLPVEKHRNMDITLYRFLNIKPPVKYAIRVPKFGSVSEIRAAIAKIACESDPQHPVKPEEIVLADVFQSKIYKFLSDSFNISQLNDNDTIVAYEVPGLSKESHSEYESANSMSSNKPHPFLTIRLMTTEKFDSYYYGAQIKQVNVGQPFVIPFDRKAQTNKQLYDTVLNLVKRYLKVDQLPAELDLNRPETLFPTATPAEDTSSEAGTEVTTKPTKPELFCLKWEPSSTAYSYTSSDENNDAPINYTDEAAVVEEPEEEKDQKSNLSSNYSYMYTSNYKKPTKRELVMFIQPQILGNCVDKEQFAHIELHSSVSGGKTSAAGGVSLADCISLFSTKEKLAKEDTWYCPMCKKHVQATKKFDIWKLPETLVIHLKRFQFNRYSRDKLDTFIDYPLQSLDMSQFLPEEARNQPHTVYDLYAVSNHFGGLGGGHYTAYAKIDETGKWYRFDDSMASPVGDANSVKSTAGYVLFYTSRNSGKVSYKGYAPLPLDEKVDFTAAESQQQQQQQK